MTVVVVAALVSPHICARFDPLALLLVLHVLLLVLHVLLLLLHHLLVHPREVALCADLRRNALARADFRHLRLVIRLGRRLGQRLGEVDHSLGGLRLAVPCTPSAAAGAPSAAMYKSAR